MAGRGRLSSIELLGEDYEDIVVWAGAELRARNQLQIDIHGEFNRRLAARADEIGEDPAPQISPSAFGRYAVNLAKMARRLEHTREISRVLTERLQPGDTDAVTIALAEAIKTAVFEAIGEAGDGGLGLEDLKFAGQALAQAVAAQRASSKHRAELDIAIAAKAGEIRDAATAAVNKVAAEAGLSQAAADLINMRIAGVAAPAKPAPDPLGM